MSSHLLIGEMADDIFKEIVKKIASSRSGMLKLLPYPSITGRKNYLSEGEDTTQHLLLPHSITELGDMQSFGNVAKTNVFQ